MSNSSNIQQKITHSRSKSSINMDIDVLDDVSSEDEVFKPITEIMKHIIESENENENVNVNERENANENISKECEA